MSLDAILLRTGLKLSLHAVRGKPTCIHSVKAAPNNPLVDTLVKRRRHGPGITRTLHDRPLELDSTIGEYAGGTRDKLCRHSAFRHPASKCQRFPYRSATVLHFLRVPLLRSHHPAEMMAAQHQSASELVGSAPEASQAQGVGEGDQSEEAVRRRLNRAREERESLARIVEQNRLEEALESQLANRRQNGNGSAAGVLR